MSIESREDLIALKKIGRIVAMTLRAMKAGAVPGITTRGLDQIGAAILKRSDARSAPQVRYGFPGTTCISVNDEVVHGIPGDRILQEGDLLTIDVTAERDGYIADAAVSLVAGRSSQQTERLIGCAERAFRKAMRFARSDRPIRRLGQAVERQVKSEGFHVLHELTGHGVGREIHEEPTVPNYHASWMSERFEEGQVVTVEPIISAGTSSFDEAEDGWTTRTRDGSLAAHHEHTLVITSGKPIILTSAA